ncbi:serpin family protein [Histomonas meleagridis]|uniref:serpin family protein n=1 Tax=Histomonas meleagridis TaxID=135588 RepID=UPI003559C136|nr:serpin family protein [Histomonas meleagridis]KAH0806686.1 serpin family protein [Histomonas meleagridis]
MGGSSSSTTTSDASNNAAQVLSFKMLSSLLKDNENIVISPYSAYVTLMMVASVCPEFSRKQILEALHLKDDLTPEEILSALKILIKKIEDTSEATIRSCNNIWPDAKKGKLNLLQPLKDHLGIKITPVEFPQPGCDIINQKVSELTEGCIKDLLQPSDLEECKYVITNALYFNAEWINQFDPDYTRDLTFYNFNGTEKTQFMHETSDFMYYQNSDLQILGMDYHGDYCLQIFLPTQKDINSFNKLKDSLTMQYASYIKQLRREEVRVDIPKFKFEWGTKSIVGVLHDLGITDVFVAEEDQFYINDIVQKAYIDVNEAGTTAAAATAAETLETCLISPNKEPPTFVADHPFIFTIANKNGTILFTGAYQKP